VVGPILRKEGSTVTNVALRWVQSRRSTGLQSFVILCPV